MSAHENDPLVSVCLTTYNRPHYLTGVIDCWLAQTYKNFELIISDDASTDGKTQKICEEYAKKDPRIRYYRQEKNLKLPLNFKFTLREARGKYFILPSDDDLYDKQFLEECVMLLEEEPALVGAFVARIDIDKDKKQLWHVDPAKYAPLSRDTYERLKEFMLFYFDDGKFWPLFSGLWKKELVMRDPMFGYRAKDDRYPYYWGFDPFFMFRILGNGPVGFVPQAHFFRRSRALEEYRPPRPFLSRIAVTYYHRMGKIFNSPYFWYVAWHIMSVEKLSLWQKTKLEFWNLYTMVRLFFVRKV